MHEPDYSWVDRELEEIRAPRKLSPPHKACKRHLKTLARLVFYVACDVHADTEADNQSGLAWALRSIAVALGLFSGNKIDFDAPEREPGVPIDFAYVDTRLRELNGTFNDCPPGRSLEFCDMGTLLNRVACRLPVESRYKNLARALHQIAAQLVLVSKLDHELDVPAAADLMHARWHSGISYWSPSKDGAHHGDNASVYTEPSSPPSSASERVTLHARHRRTTAAVGDPAPSGGTHRYHPRGRRVRRQRWKWNQ